MVNFEREVKIRKMERGKGEIEGETTNENGVRMNRAPTGRRRKRRRIMKSKKEKSEKEKKRKAKSEKRKEKNERKR